MKQTWHGPSASLIEAGGARMLIDSSGYVTDESSTQGDER
jgi:hypothetical protein